MRRELTKYLRLPTLDRSRAGAVASRRPALVGGLLLVLMLLTGLGWAVSSPVESSPDEDFHLGASGVLARRGSTVRPALSTVDRWLGSRWRCRTTP